MKTLKLGIYQLPAAEVVLIRTLLRLYGYQGTSVSWALAERPPYDAMLVDGAAADSLGDEVRRMAKAVLRVTRLGDAGEQRDTISRPIRADKLLQWLNGCQTGSPVVAQSAPVIAEVSVPQVSSARYQLRRWPPAAVLRNDVRRIRLATLILKRPFSAADLATVSLYPVEECWAFLRLLDNVGLVDVHGDPVSTSAPPPTPLPKSASPVRFGMGVIRGLRRKLGL